MKTLEDYKRKAEIDYAIAAAKASTGPTQLPPPSVVYFISCRDCVKIGIARDTAFRLREMQVHCPYEMTLLGVTDGGRSVERGLHQRFARYRIRGEWFSLSDEIQQFIRENCL
jgi:hypothetical protein